MNLTVKITRYDDDWCLMEVLEQSKIGFDKFLASNGWWVKSIGTPEIGDNRIFLRGSDGINNSKPVVFRASDLDNVLTALREFKFERCSEPKAFEGGVIIL